MVLHANRPLPIRSRLLNAAGPAGCGDDFDQWDYIGAFVTQSITTEPRTGNPGERLFDAPAGLINRVGLDNPGIAQFLGNKLPKLLEKNVPIILSLAGEHKYDYVSMIRQSLGSGISAFELNFSCPNTGTGYPFTSAMAVEEALSYIRNETNLPLLLKLSVAMPLKEMIRVSERAGVDGLTLINTVPARSSDGYNGGLSGSAIKHIALRAVWEARQVTELPIIGVGGVTRPSDLRDLLEAGATAVGVGTAWIAEPSVFEKLHRSDALS